MRVLVVDAYPAGHCDEHVVGQVVDELRVRGHAVELVSLAGAEFGAVMTAAEWAAYETDQPLLATETKASAESVKRVDGLLFCYPTTLFGVPARLKSWLERVMVMGVAFVFDDKQRVRPGLTNVRRIGVVTTSPHSRRATWNARDLGYRTFMRTLRLNCHPRCRRTFVRLATGAPHGRSADCLNRALARW